MNDNPIITPKPLTDEQVTFFVEQGYLIVEGLVSLEELEELRADALHLARGGYPCKTLQPLPPETTDDDALKQILCIHQPHYVSPVIEKYVRHAQICGALSQIAAAHLPFWDGSVKCMQSMLFVKPPTFPGQAWHQDEIYIPTRDRSLVGAWIALDPATQENGCLWVIPGSHKEGYLYPQRAHDNHEDHDFAPESHGFDESLAIPVEVPAGAVVFFNGYLLHRSLKNRSELYRRVLVSHYMNAWSRLPWSVKEGESPATADRRCVISVAGVDPYAWAGYETPPGNVWLRTFKKAEEEAALEESEEAEEETADE